MRAGFAGLEEAAVRLAGGRFCVVSLAAGPRGPAGALVHRFSDDGLGWVEDEPPTLLGDADADVVAPARPAWPGMVAGRRLRMRRIDTLFEGAAVGVIVLAGGAAAALRGAAATLTAARPVVMVDARGLDGAARAEVAAAAPGYRLEGTGAVLAAGAGATRAVDWAALEGAALEGAALEGAALDGAALGLGEAGEMVFEADDWLSAPGFHPRAERDGGRWSGAAPDTALVLARPLHGRWRLLLEMADWGNAGRGFPIGVDGAWLAPRGVTASGVKFGPFGIDPMRSPSLRLDLFGPPPVADLRRFPRKLGYCLRRVVLSPA